jgi:hypothetical protein
MNGHLKILIFLRSGRDKCPWDERSCAYAAKNGHIDILIYLRSGPDKCPWNLQECVEAALAHNHKQVLNFLQSNSNRLWSDLFK